jgi:MFS family permease
MDYHIGWVRFRSACRRVLDLTAQRVKIPLIIVIVGSSISTYNIGIPSMMKDLNCTEFQAAIGLSVFALGLGALPLVSTSFSEEVGRRPLYIGSLVVHMLLHLTIAL